MSKAKIVKDIVKKNVGEPSTFGTDPRDPWSAKSNLKEWAGNPKGLLGKYLKSRGINPKFATKDQKIAHSKTGKFQKWQRDHAERSSPTGTTVHEEVDKKDTITFDIPLIIRVMELAREDLKSDMDLHKVVEKLINIRNQGTLTMDDYDYIANIKEQVMSSVPLEHIKTALTEAIEDYERLANTSPKYADVRYPKPAPNELRVMRQIEKEKAEKAKKKKVAEAKEANYGGDYQAAVLRFKEKAAKKPVDMKSLAARMQAAYAKEDEKKKTVKEDISRRGVLKGILGAAGAGAAGKASAIAGAFPSPSTREKWRKDAEESNRNEAKRQAEKKKKELEDNTKEVERQQKINHHSLANESALPRNLVWDGEHVKKDPAVVAGNKRKKNYQAYLRRKAAKEKAQESVKENMEPLAACACSGDGANTPDDVAPKDKNKKLIQMSKSARIIKSIYKNKGMKEEVLDETWKYHTYNSKEEANSARNAHHAWRDGSGKASGNPARLMPGNRVAYKGEFKGPKPIKEELYDHEKEDKSTAPLGKKPKMQKLGADAETLQAPQAAAVLTGGKTMTGEPRDTIEIDPMMKMRKQSGNSQKNV